MPAFDSSAKNCPIGRLHICPLSENAGKGEIVFYVSDSSHGCGVSASVGTRPARRNGNSGGAINDDLHEIVKTLKFAPPASKKRK